MLPQKLSHLEKKGARHCLLTIYQKMFNDKWSMTNENLNFFIFKIVIISRFYLEF
jgi:hypothetical protein